MIIYYALFVYSFLGFFVVKVKEVSNYGWFIVGVFICFFVASLRSGSDFDYFSYLSIFKEIPPLSDGLGRVSEAASNIYAENAFIFFVSFLKIFLNDIYIFPVFCFLSLSLYFYAFKYSKYAVAAWFVYFCDGFFLREFTQIRFGLSVSLCLVAFVFLARKNLKFYLFSILASMFHYAAIVIFIARLWVACINSIKRVKCITVIFFALWGLDASKIFITGLVSSGLAPERLMIYSGEGSTDALAVSWIFILSQFVLVMLSLRKLTEKDGREIVYASIYSLSFCLLCVFSDFDLLRRLTFIFSVVSYLLVLVAFEKKNYLYLFVVFVWSCLLFYSRLNILFDYSVFF